MPKELSFAAPVEADIVPNPSGRPNRNAALVYLAGLSEGSRRTRRGALNTIASILTSDRADAITLPWWQLRFQHTASVRSHWVWVVSQKRLYEALRGIFVTQNLIPMKMDAESVEG